MFGEVPRRQSEPMLATTPQIQTSTSPAQRHEFAYPRVTPVAVRAHTILASSLARLADSARPVVPARAV